MRLLLLVVDDLTTMSGVEAVGLALGVLPLIIVAIEKYEKISDLIGTYRKYSKAVGRFSTELAVQRVIFQNECVLLLSQVVDDGRALHDMFNEPAHSLRTSLRNDSKLDQKLLQRVNERAHDSYEQIVALLQLIEHNLRQIYDETKGYRDSLGNEVRPEVGCRSDYLIPLLAPSLTCSRETRSYSKIGHRMCGGKSDSHSERLP